MKASNLYATLISYTFIFIGLGMVLEVSLLRKAHFEILSIPFRYFYWTFNLITLSHLLLLLVFYNTEKDELKRTRLLFFSVVNHFVVSLIAIGLYAYLWLEGTKMEALIAVGLYLFTFVFFIAVVVAQVKQS